MSLRRSLTVVGVLALIGGAAAMFVPRDLDTVFAGHTIKCGRAIDADIRHQAEVADEYSRPLAPRSGGEPTSHVEECRALVSTRRSRAIPVAIAGAIVLLGSVMARAP